MQFKFWLIWNPRGKYPPSYQHFSREDAEIEADRLASLHPQGTFYILESVLVAQGSPGPVRFDKTDGVDENYFEPPF